MTTARKAVMGLFVAALLLGAVEVGLRLAGWPAADPARKFTHNEVYWSTPADLHLEPFDHKERSGTFAVSTDANGVRAPLHTAAKPAGTYRVMTLGCSTTFGWGVDDTESYPARLEAILAEEGHPVEVINGGQPGHSSFQGLWFWDKVLHLYQPDLVVFGYIVQDARTVAYSDRSQAVLQGNADFLKRNLLYRLKLYVLLRDLIAHEQIVAKETGDVQRVPPAEYVENIRAFKDRTDAAGARLMLFGYPLEREGYTASHRAILHAAAADQRLGEPPLYDPQPEMETLSSQQSLYFPQDRGHANAAGSEVIARGMAQFLVAHQLVP